MKHYVPLETYLFFNYILLIMLLQLSWFFSLYPPPPSTPHSLRQSPHHRSYPWVMGMSFLATPFPILYFTSHGYSVTTSLYFLIPSPLHLLPRLPLSSGNHQNHDSVSVLLVCLVCFLDSIVDRFIFFAILLFIVLIFFFFLNKSL